MVQQLERKTQPCPYCNELIVIGARKCRYCHEFLDDTEKLRRRKTAGLDQRVMVSNPSKGKLKIVGGIGSMLIGVSLSASGWVSYALLKSPNPPEGELVQKLAENKEKALISGGVLAAIGLCSYFVGRIQQWYYNR